MNASRIIAVLAAAVVVLVAPVVAEARTIQQDIDAAHAYWQSDVCAGQWQVTPDTPENHGTRSGAATGIGFTHNPTSGSYADAGTRWDWHIARCEFTLDPRLQGCDREETVRHEVGHFVHGPSHAGPMSSPSLARVPCSQTPPMPTRRSTAVAMARDLLPAGYAWRVNCNPRTTRCVARAPRARRARYFDVDGSGLAIVVTAVR